MYEPDELADYVEDIHRYHKGYLPRYADPSPGVVNYRCVAYGWPFRNWGTLFADRPVLRTHGTGASGIDAVLAVNLRPMWPEADMPDPVTRWSQKDIAAFRGAGMFPSSTGTDPYQRYLPIMPLGLNSLLASLLYGTPFFIILYRRDLRRRRGLCSACAYDLTALPAAAPCPECGTPRPTSRRARPLPATTPAAPRAEPRA
jgi:hypothetical protein